jgi:hypothetical protein
MIEQTLWNDAGLSPAPSRQTPLQLMLAEIAAVVRDARSATERRLATVLAHHVSAPDLLDGIICPTSAARR